MKKIFSLIFFLLIALDINAQTGTAKPLSWKGMTIDVSNPNDVISKFGNPEKDELDRIGTLDPKHNLFTQNTGKKQWRTLKYKEIEQVPNVQFAFDNDNKLVFIKFDPSLKDRHKLIDIQAFLKSFEDIKFKPKEGFVLNTYIVSGKQESGYVFAAVSRGVAGLFERKSIFDTKTIEDVPNDDLDGVVYSVQFISKSLENSDNTNVLK